MITFCAFFVGLYTLAFSRIRKDYRELNSKGLLIAEITFYTIYFGSDRVPFQAHRFSNFVV